MLAIEATSGVARAVFDTVMAGGRVDLDSWLLSFGADYDKSPRPYADVTKLRAREDLAREALRRELAAARALFDRCESLADAFGLQSDVQDLQQRIAALDVQLEGVGAVWHRGLGSARK
ncbi:hypothetical protein [Castellaniella caeni]|uniref:hypothetical protein n=1 Tax=Castellaniella caeni TaxID=266123 RepID=UPI00082AEF79|nr:hypothetical protein [Castellaniella caeni]